MTLIRTHDGRLGWIYENKVRWFDTVSRAKNYALLHWGFNRIEYAQFSKGMDYALENMARTGHTVAEFGAMGGFMYTETELHYGT